MFHTISANVHYFKRRQKASQSFPSPHMQRSPHWEYSFSMRNGVTNLSKFDRPVDTNINVTNRRNLPRNRTNPIMKPHLWIQMNENHRGANEWPHDYPVDLTTGVNWFIHEEADQNRNMNIGQIDQKRKKKKGKVKHAKINSCTSGFILSFQNYNCRDYSIHFRKYLHTIFKKQDS